VNRRVSLPGADALSRTAGGRGEPRRGDAARGSAAATGRGARSRRDADGGSDDAGTEASGRVRHDQKITVYLTGQELVDLEQARLRLRAEFDIAVDRGRIVREAVAELLRDLDEEGPDAAIVRRLS
jgi:hypothetical protein